jgi:malonyl-CoA/methylmalonyl-CoA synthetase
MASSIELFDRAERFHAATAIVTPEGTYSYRQLLTRSGQVADALLAGARDLDEARIVFMLPPGLDYVAVQWGIWRAGGVAVPLACSHPEPEVAHVVDDAKPAVIVTSSSFTDRLGPIAEARSIRLLSTSQLAGEKSQDAMPIDITRRAMILYTSGTTGKPKGVVTTHQNIQAQVESLVEAWQWSSDDHILHVLPLHHVHGIINALTCALWVGAQCEVLPRFEASTVWERLTSGDVTLFMAVPTMYWKLIAAWQQAAPDQQKRMSAGCGKLRLMISGSAPLPASTLEAWKEITGHVLLERYGMTEIGMALSNPLDGQRVPGHVGTPLPNVEVRRVDEQGNLVGPSVPGEIEVRGPGVFLEYWGQPDDTRNAFRAGWFRTGDVAVVEDGAYRILGRMSVDIIKTGGYKVSALEIEESLHAHPDIRECAVVGVPDSEWGQHVAAAIVLKPGRTLMLPSLRAWAKERLAVYKIPKQIIEVPDLPRNAMGKVTKAELVRLFQ